MSSDTLLVTGASGHLGRLVLESLLSRKGSSAKIIATTRDPQKLADFAQRGVEVRAADFAKPETLLEAFKGATRLLLISTDAIGSRTEQHRNAIEAAKKAGVRHVLYTSYPNPGEAPALVAPEHHQTEEIIKKSGLSYTFLRNNLYSENLLGSLAGAFKAGAMIGSTSGGKTAYVTRADCAAAAAGALASSDTSNRALDITGPDALSAAEIAKIASDIIGRPLPYIDMPDSDFKAALVKSGLPEIWADVYVSFDATARKGLAAGVTDNVAKLSGRPAQDLRSFLKANLKV